jgi:alpha-D-glucose phosphate-specific phosphoglucomutase
MVTSGGRTSTFRGKRPIRSRFLGKRHWANKGVRQIKSPIKFGTDGWRAIIAQDFTFDNVRFCAQAVADYLKQSGRADYGLVIGYDTRFASENFAAAAAEVIAANGVKVYLCPEATPTPVVSFGIQAQKAGGGIIITASHNPAIWNGFKYKTEVGASASTEVIAALEKNISHLLTTGSINRMPLAEAIEQGAIKYLDLSPLYFAQLKSLIDLKELRQSKLKIVVDSMYGAGAGYFKKLLDGGSVEVTEINSERNPLFPGVRPEPIAVNLTKLSAAVRRRKANVGLATDGDADRIGIVDEKGIFITQLQVFALLVLYLLEIRGERGAIVKTITTTSMLYRLGEMFGVPVHETQVGFKYVAPRMLAEGALIGGEESGGYGFRGHVPERDGVLAGLYFLDLMVKTGKSPSELIDYLYRKVGPHHYHRTDIEFPENERQAIIERIKQNPPDSIEGVKVVKSDATDGFRFTLADTTWLLIRFSGTEPLLRIYAESDSPARVEQLLEAGKKLAGV